MYLATRYFIQKADPLYAYFDAQAHYANNLHNATLFRIRQVLTATKKDTLTPNEQEVMDEIRAALPKMNKVREDANKKRKEKDPDYKETPPFEMPTAECSLLNSAFIDALMKVTNNPDYFAPLPRQTTQTIIKEVCGDVSNFFKAIKSYNTNPAPFTGEPKLPHYKKPGGVRNVVYTNQDCIIKDGFLKFPHTKLTLELGRKVFSCCTLKQVEAIPYYGGYMVCVTVDDTPPPPKKSKKDKAKAPKKDKPKAKKKPPKKDEKKAAEEVAKKAKRIVAIDFGVDNIAAIANNIGKPGLLFKGGKVKSANQWFNKKRASIVHGITSGRPTTEAPHSKSLDRLSRWRNGFIETELHTYAKKIVNTCVEWKIDTIVLGVNKGWKQNVEMSKVNNQTFVSIPFYKFRQYIAYLAERAGIAVIEQEESYTSKASLLSMDPMPVYGQEGAEDYKFSGYRKSRGCYKIKGKQGREVNADLNGAGNILRKAIPNAFDRKRNKFLFLDTIIVM